MRPTAQQLAGFQVLRAKMTKCRPSADQEQTRCRPLRRQRIEGGGEAVLGPCRWLRTAHPLGAWLRSSPRTKESHQAEMQRRVLQE